MSARNHSPGATLVLEEVTKRFDGVPAVDGVSLTVAPGELLALLGPSGCGKSTLLAVLAGLVHPEGGDVRVDGVSVLGVAAERRDVSLVFQKPLLFPHLSVADNVAFGLRMRGVRRVERVRRAQEMLERVHLSGLGGRRVGELSGGQEQRVALARALVLAPRVLLLDEPFSALDASLRAEMRTLVRELHASTGVTTVFVTHDQGEAVEVAGRVALMTDGALAGVGEPEAFYTRPPTLAAARFFGVTNEVDGPVDGGVFTGGGVDVGTDVADGPAVLVARPEALRLHAPVPDTPDPPVPDSTAPDTPAPSGSTVRGTVVAARFAGTHVVAEVAAAGTDVVWTVHVGVGEAVAVGSRATVRVPAGACTVFPR